MGSRLWLDWCGSAASLACGIHCGAWSLYLLLNPLIWLQQARYGSMLMWFRWLEIGFVALAVVFAVLAMAAGFQRHHRPGPALLAVLGLGLIFAGMLGGLHDRAPLGSGLALAGGVVMVAAHRYNAVCRQGG